MTNEVILKYIEFVSNKEQTGNTLDIEDFNVILQVANLEYYRDVRKIYEANLEITNIIKHLKVVDTTLSIAGGTGIASIPDNYVYGGQLFYTQTVDAINYHRKIDLVTDKEFNRRLASIIEKASVKYPIAKLVDESLYFEPKTIGSAKFSYIKSHTIPNLDYYIDANDVEQFLLDPTDIESFVPETTYNTGNIVKWTNTNYYYVSQQNSNTGHTPEEDGAWWKFASDYTYKLLVNEEGSGGEGEDDIVNSSTVDMDWRDEDKLIIADKILRMMGINLTQEQLLAYYNQKVQETVSL